MTSALQAWTEFAPGWLPSSQALAIFFLTFVLEDVAAVGAGLLLAAGMMTWPEAFVACFLGIWMGDAALYALARFAGRPWLERSFLRTRLAKVAAGEAWFAQRGDAILVFSRVIPGTRLPTYLAAGFLRVPLHRFLIITGLASLVWTFVLLALTHAFGKQAQQWLGVYQYAWLFLVATGLVLFAALHLIRRGALAIQRRATPPWLARWLQWEFWPAWVFYPPVAFWCLWLAIKYRGLTLPTAANPGIFSGGIVGESKHATLNQLGATSPEFTARSALLAHGDFEARMDAFDKACNRLGLQFPVILKPDIGQRGAGVKLIRTREQAVAYFRKTTAPLLLQQYCAGPFEVGVFYYRFPAEAHGRIFAITEKIFPTVTGDGSSSVGQLIARDPRARIIAGIYLDRLGSRRDDVLPAGTELKLVEAGNHAQGCLFRDGHRLHSPELEVRVDDLSRKLEGFFIGRYDIRYESEEELRAGRNFQIIELNGAASEATNIYDSRNSLWSAYRTLFRQWELVFAIGAANRKRGCAPTRLALVWRAWREYSTLAASYPIAD